MELQLDRPIVFLDLETTGTDIATDRIVELAFLRVEQDQKQTLLTRRLNPEMPIPEEAANVHGISDADVKNAPTFAQVAEELRAFIEGCDLAGFNSERFDIPLLAEEFLRCGVDPELEGRRRIDVQTIFHKKEQRDLSAAYRFYCDKELKGAHGAEADTYATYEILKGQLSRYEDLRNDMEHLHEYSTKRRGIMDLAGRIGSDKHGRPVFNFGKFKGRPVKEVFEQEPGYYGWLMKADFPLYTKKVIKRIRESMKEA